MTGRDFLTTINCPKSTLQTIAAALNWARFRAQCAHNDDDAEEFQHAHKLALELCVNGILNSDPVLHQENSYTDADAPQTQDYALSEFVPF